MFRKVLVSNRGEIAVRVAKTLKQMGIRVATVYAQEEGNPLHLRFADEAYPLVGASLAETYLNAEKIVEIARSHGVDAIHPGYGFLSENPRFARLCREAGITFIGPSPEAMEAMGDKLVAKRTATQAGVPVVPGTDELDSRDPRAVAEKIGYPVLIKAAEGGGGRGVRLVEKPDDFLPALEAARRESQSAFGSPRVFVEKFVSRPRHVEFQVFGDQHENVVHLFERECSIQRRYQKIVEESPSPALSPALRNEMGEAAVRVARAVGYVNAGTVEFMLDESGRYYFLEMNTRLQVEHPVTELVTGLDLVRAQIAVAAGEKLPFSQEAITRRGHAMECRIYAEDPFRDFLPSTGTLEAYIPPSGPDIRVDSGVETGSRITVHYDPMLAKLVVWGATRAEALRKTAWALEHFVILGVTTNLEFLQDLMAQADFQSGKTHTQFLEAYPVHPRQVPDLALLAAALYLEEGKKRVKRAEQEESNGPWEHGGPWRAFP